jgi:acetyl/propionyl-CoA carboxylase alpha subunit
VLFLEGEAWAFGLPVAGQWGRRRRDGRGRAARADAGRIVVVDTAQGSGVNKGQKLIVMEAMKMELVVSAPFDGVVGRRSSH